MKILLTHQDTASQSFTQRGCDKKGDEKVVADDLDPLIRDYAENPQQPGMYILNIPLFGSFIIDYDYIK